MQLLYIKQTYFKTKFILQTKKQLMTFCLSVVFYIYLKPEEILPAKAKLFNFGT